MDGLGPRGWWHQRWRRCLPVNDESRRRCCWWETNELCTSTAAASSALTDWSLDLNRSSSRVTLCQDSDLKREALLVYHLFLQNNAAGSHKWVKLKPNPKLSLKEIHLEVFTLFLSVERATNGRSWVSGWWEIIHFSVKLQSKDEYPTLSKHVRHVFTCMHLQVSKLACWKWCTEQSKGAFCLNWLLRRCQVDFILLAG